MPFTSKRPKDYLFDKAAASYLARKIEAYWHRRGFHAVRTFVVTETWQDKPLYVIRSENIPTYDYQA